MTIEEIQQLREENKTYQEIGDKFGVSRQRVHAKFTGYVKRYQRTEKYKEYSRHRYIHSPGSKPYKPCKYCTLERNVSIDL